MRLEIWSPRSQVEVRETCACFDRLRGSVENGVHFPLEKKNQQIVHFWGGGGEKLTKRKKYS